MNEISSFLQTFVTETLTRLSIFAQGVSVEEKDELTYRVDITTPDANLVIGHFGDTLSALQYLVKNVAMRKFPEAGQLFIICDVDGYKSKQEDKVNEMADRGVDAVRSSGMPYHLPPMSPYFRKVVHNHLKQFEAEGISTHSEGEGDERHIVVEAKAA